MSLASRAVGLFGLLVLAVIGAFFLIGLSLPDGYRVYCALVSATWAVLFAAAVGRWRSHRGQIWRLVAMSPLLLLGPLLGLLLVFAPARAILARDLKSARNFSGVRLGFPLGAPTGRKLLLAIALSVGVFVADALFMIMWVGLAGGNPSTTFVLWFVLAPSTVLSLAALMLLVAGWISARRSSARNVVPVDARRS